MMVGVLCAAVQHTHTFMLKSDNERLYLLYARHLPPSGQREHNTNGHFSFVATAKKHLIVKNILKMTQRMGET